MYRALLVLLIAICLVTPAFAAGFSNGGFENPLWSPWVIGGGGSMNWLLDVASPHSGNQCAVGVGGSNTVYEGSLGWVGMDLLPGTAYVLSAWVRTEGSRWGVYGGSYNNSWFKAMLLESDGVGSWGSTGSHDTLIPVQAPLPSWTQLFSSFTTGSATNRGYLLIRGHLASPSDTIAFDDVDIEPLGNSIRLAKLGSDGTPVHFSGKIVSRPVWGDRLYITESDRSVGIGVMNTASVSTGQVVTVDGTKTTLHGEAFISPASVSVTSSAAAPKPYGLSGNSFQSGPPSAGLLVKVWGRVTSGLFQDGFGTCFTVSDGSASEIKVYVGNTGATPPTTGRMVGVTGISSLDGENRVVLLASKSDLKSYFGDSTPETVPEWIYAATGIARVSFSLAEVMSAITDGASVVEVPIRDLSSAYYPSNIVPANATYGNGVLLRQLIDYAHNHGAKLIGSMQACKDSYCLALHTDWRQRPTDSTSWLTAPADQVTGCLVSPYGTYLRNEVLEQAQEIGLDGITFQGYSNTQAFCYCTYCKAKYLADTGGSIPASVNYDDANFRRYLLWHDEQIIAHFTALRSQVRAANPDFGILSWSANAGEYSHFLASPRVAPTALNGLFDCAMQRPYYDDANLGLSVVPEFGIRYLAGLTRHRPFVAEADYTTRNADRTPGITGSSMPEAEVQFRMLSAIAAGSTFAFSSAEKRYMRPSLMAMASARAPWTYRAVAVKWAAMVVSETTRQFYGRTDAGNRYMRSCFGFFRALLDAHVPVEIISEADLESGLASGYSVLILPNTACLSAAGLTAVRSFVSSGGGLVATSAASLYDENGTARGDFGLADLFGVSKSGAPVSVVSRAAVLDTAYLRNQSTLSKMLSPYGHVTSYTGDVIPVTLQGGAATMATVCSDGNCATAYPAYVTSVAAGGGRVAYFPAGMDAAFFNYTYPYEGVLLRDAVNWVASVTPNVTVSAPKTVQATFFTQNEGKRLVIHLLNATNSRSGHANPANDVPARDEVVPVYDVEVWFNNNVPAAVALQPEGTPLTLVQEGGRAKVVVPVVSQHSMVVADLP